MTLKERVIVTAYTGVAMVCGKELSHFYAYAEELMGRPLMTHDFARDDICDALKEKSKDDFIALCKAESVTNADRIRNMSDEELANFVARIAYARETPWSKPFADKFCKNCPVTLVESTHPPMSLYLNECDFADGECPHGSDIVWWLQQTAEAEPHEQQ